MNETGLNWGSAQAHLEVSCGMTPLGAQHMLEAARRDGSTESATLYVVCTNLYPERFEITDKLNAR